VSPEEAIAKAERVKRLVSDPDLADAFVQVRGAILDKIEQCPIRDTEGAEKLRLMLKLLNDVRANLTAAIEDGKMAQFQIEEKRRFKLFKR
jgi:hypothetical protein